MQFPLSRITIAFILGILFAHLSNVDFILAAISVAFSLVVFCILYFRTLRQLQPNASFGLVTYCLCFCIGIFTLSIHDIQNQSDNYTHQIRSSESPHSLEIVVREKLKSTNYYDRYVALVHKIDQKQCTGKILLNLKKDALAKDISIGTQITVVTPIVLHRPPLNPNQFDYGRYLSAKSIPAQIYIRDTSFKMSNVPVKDIYYYSDLLRSTLLTNLEKAHFRFSELQVFAALLLGQQQGIAREVVLDYQLAGAVHILSVSGLHVGFIVLFMGFLLKRLPKTIWGSLIQLILTVTLLWGFAFIAGLSPSVIRSVTMFSFVAIGLHLKRKTNTFHTLLSSLFLILLVEPSFLFDVGFQLSYLALFFILWMQPLLSKIWQPKNRMTSYLWDILTVSFAAQIGTFPLSVYYFHQFPGLFFVTNLITIPLLSVIMALGLLLLLLSSFGVTPSLLVATVEHLITWLNNMIHTVASFDEFVFTGISLHWSIVITLYLLIISITLYCSKPIYNRLLPVMMAIVLFQGNYFYNQWKINNEKEWIVFHLPKSTLIAQRNGNKVVLFRDRGKWNKEPIQSYLTATCSELVQERPLQNLMYAQNKMIAILDSSRTYPPNANPDVLLLRQSPKVNLERVFRSCKPKIVIADASNYRSYVALWNATCRKAKIPFHNTYEKGFYKLE